MGVRRGIASLNALVARGEEAVKRGWFGVNALRRIATNEDPRAQLVKEKTYFQAHKAAQEKRRAVAAQVDAAAARYGPVLGWRAKMDERTTAECRASHGKNFRAYRPPAIGLPGTVHPHCLPGKTLIAAGVVDAVTARWYMGSLVQISTARGYELSVTPNHPILTPDGWQPACLLMDAGYVVSCGEPQRVPLGLSPDYDNSPILIEDVFQSFSVLGSASTVPGASVDFHGDGFDSDVHIVWSDSFLSDWTETFLFEKAIESSLSGRNISHSALTGFRSSNKLFQGLALSPDSGMGGLGVSPIFGRTPICHHELIGDSGVAYGDTLLLEDSDYDAAANPVTLCEDVLGVPGKVALDKIIDVRRVPFADYIYNLQGQYGWYIADNIITHNCRCEITEPYPNAKEIR